MGIFVRDFLEKSLWTPELEYALGWFSISTYLNWCDDLIRDDLIHASDREWARLAVWNLDMSFPVIFLRYLEDMVSNPWLKTKYYLQLFILIRDNPTFITIIPCIIRNTPHLPSTILPVERNSPP